jgi:hypothetical protein
MKPPIFPGPNIEPGPYSTCIGRGSSERLRPACPTTSTANKTGRNLPCSTRNRTSFEGFALHHARGGRIPGDPKRHDLVGWHEAAMDFGLEREPSITENIALLNELHESHYMQYPKRSARAVPDLGAMADQTVDHLIFEITQVVNPR